MRQTIDRGRTLKTVIYFLILIIAGCANNRPIASFKEAKDRYGHPRDCEQIQRYKYCKWFSDIMVFKDGTYLKNMPAAPSLETFLIRVSTKGRGQFPAVMPVPGSHVMKEDWIIQLPLIKGMLRKNNIPQAATPSAGEALVIDYGLSKKNSQFFLTLKTKSWVVELRTTHPVRNVDLALPVLLSAIEIQYLSQPLQKIRNNSLRVEGLKDFSVNYLK